MRICCIADGRSIHSYRWLQFFCGRGHKVHFVSYAPLESRHLAAIREAGGVYQGLLDGFYIKRFWRTLRNLGRLIRLLHRERIDLLQCQFLGANAWYAALSHFHPMAISVMGGGDVCGPDWRPESTRARLLTPFALRRASLVTCWSEQLAKVVRRYCPPDIPVKVIHGGIDHQQFSPGPRPNSLLERWGLSERAKVILSTRLMRPLSNLDKLAFALHTLLPQHPDAYCLFLYPDMAKDAAYEATVREIVNRGPGRERVRFAGAIRHEEMADYFRLADVTVSIPDTDGTPMTALESMACGTPVVVGDLADYDIDYFEPGKTVLVANQRDPSSIARAIHEVFRDPEGARRRAAEGRRRVEAWGGYEAQMLRMERLYEGLVR